MGIALKNALTDGQLSFERGVDTYRAPIRVPRNQLCLLVNGTTRGDFIGPRSGWRQLPLTFENSEQQEGFEDGYFQAFSGYVPDAGPSHVVFSTSGVLYRINALADLSVQTIAVPNARPTNRQQVWFTQGELFLICQDGQSKPLIYWGSEARESDVFGQNANDPDGGPAFEVPVGTCMAYSGGRLWVTLPDGRSFVAGDGVNGPTGTAAFSSRDSILKFTENQYWDGGFPFAVPANMGPIRAMIPVANLDTSLGQGPLQVFTPSGCFSIEAPFDRAAWAVMQNPIKTVSLFDMGALSPVGLTLVNGDVWYRSMDGVRSFFIARRDFGTWGNRSMSAEVSRHLQDDDVNLLKFCSAALYDNRLLVTCAPTRDPDHGVYHSGLVALDFLPLSSIQGSSPPAWDGLWAGHDILQIQTVESEGVPHVFAAVLAPEDENGDRKIQLWTLDRNAGRDTDALGVHTRLTRAIEGARLDFNARLEQKLLEACEIWVDKIRGTVDFTLSYRPDEYPCWFEWKHWQVCSTIERCPGDAIDGCMPDLNLKPQFRTRISGLRPPDGLITSTGQPSRLGYGFQIRLDIEGDCEVTAIRLLAEKIQETVFGTGLPGEASCEEIICCET